MNITLKERTRESVCIYFNKAQDEEIKRFLPQKAQTVEEALSDYEKTLLPTSTSYGKTVFADGSYVGDVWCYCIGDEDPDAMLSFCIFDKNLWGKGVCTEAVALFTEEIKEKFSLKNIGAFTFSDNIGSVKVLLKNGFKEIEEFFEDGKKSKYMQIDF